MRPAPKKTTHINVWQVSPNFLIRKNKIHGTVVPYYDVIHRASSLDVVSRLSRVTLANKLIAELEKLDDKSIVGMFKPEAKAIIDAIWKEDKQ